MTDIRRERADVTAGTVAGAGGEVLRVAQPQLQLVGLARLLPLRQDVWAEPFLLGAVAVLAGDPVQQRDVLPESLRLRVQGVATQAQRILLRRRRTGLLELANHQPRPLGVEDGESTRVRIVGHPGGVLAALAAGRS